MFRDSADAVKEGRSSPPGDGQARQNPARYFLFPPDGEPPADLAGAIALRSQQWNSSLKPWDSFECWIVDQVAYQSINLERCVLMADALARRRSRRAELVWELDRDAEAAELGSGLARRPEVVARRLRRSLHGADWLLSRWRGLGRVLEVAGDWDRPQRALALDLLGVPAEHRDPEARRGLPDGAGAMADLVRAEVAALEARRSEVLVARDAEDRAEAIAGTSFDDSPEARSLRRYEASCRRALEWARSQLKSGRHDLNSPPPVRPSRPPARTAPPPPPAPAPAWSPSPPAAPAPMASSPARSALDRFAAVAPARRPDPPPMNRRARRALEKLARRAG